jgi:transcriptional regulator GlxA family with amidase domain
MNQWSSPSPTVFRFLAMLLALGGALRPTAAADGQPKTARTLGVLLFQDFEMLDAAGPMELWGNLRKDVKMVTVARRKGDVRSAQGVRVAADFGFEDCPKLDLILVPGGAGAFKALKEADTLEWIRARAAQAEITMSVCNGASILAAAGLLDGRPATTNKTWWEQSIAPGPAAKWVRHARWVDDGNVVTSSGVSAGMDMSLHLIERLFGAKKAERIANEVEYEWHHDPTWDPFADRNARKAGR